MSVTLPIAIFMVVAAPEIVMGVLGEKWAKAILPLRILALAGFFRVVSSTGAPLFLGSGRPHSAFWMQVVRVTVLAVTVYPLSVSYGVPGTALSMLLSNIASLLVWGRVRNIAGLRWLEIGRRFVEGACIAGSTVAGVFFGRFLAGKPGTVEALLYECIAVALVGSATAWACSQFGKQGIVFQATRAWKTVRN